MEEIQGNPGASALALALSGAWLHDSLLSFTFPVTWRWHYYGVIIHPWEWWQVRFTWAWHTSLMRLLCAGVFSAHVGKFKSIAWLLSLASHSGNPGCLKPSFKHMLYCFRCPTFYFTSLVNIFQLLNENFGKTAPAMQLKNHPAETLRSSA